TELECINLELTSAKFQQKIFHGETIGTTVLQLGFTLHFYRAVPDMAEFLQLGRPYVVRVKTSRSDCMKQRTLICCRLAVEFYAVHLAGPGDLQVCIRGHPVM